MKTELGIHLGTRARAARKRLGLTQADVAEQLGIAREVYARLERGHMLPSLNTLRRVCTVLRVPPHELLALEASFKPSWGDTRPAPRETESAGLRALRKKLRGLSRADLRLMNILAGALPPPATSKRRRR